jgi:hypothetical protein
VPKPAGDRADLMTLHAAAKRRRDSAKLGSDEFARAAEEVARIEVEIAAREEAPPEVGAGRRTGS